MLDGLPSVDNNDPRPRHAQVQQILRDIVTSGRLQPGDKIPAETAIADKLGVSKMTVNKALLALTASGVFVREVGRGTFVARPVTPSFTDRPTRIVLSFVEGARNVLESDYYSRLYRGIVTILEPHLHSGNDAAYSIDLTLSALAARDYIVEDQRDPADGRIIIAPRIESIPSIEALWQRGKSLVVIGASWPAMGIPSIDSDNIGGATEAVRHLLGLGHRRVALVIAEEETANIQDRIAGYHRALSLAKLPRNPELEVRAAEAWRLGEAARRHLKNLLTRPIPVTAIFAAGHYLALEAMATIREVGLRIPEDVSVVGYDDPLSAQLFYPPLTSVRQPLLEMGGRAAERLLRLIHGQESRSPIREMLPSQLVLRCSTAPVPAPYSDRLDERPAEGPVPRSGTL